MNVLNKCLDSKPWILSVSIIAFSTLYHLMVGANSWIPVSILFFCGLSYLLNKKKIKLEETKYPVFSIIIAIPIICVDIYMFLLITKNIGLIGIILTIVSCYASFFISLLISSYITNRIGDLIKNTDKIERIFCYIGFILLSLICIIAHLSSPIFGSSNELKELFQSNLSDVLFTADNQILDNSYWLMCHPENDIRQILFGILGRPVYGFAFIISKLTTLNIFMIINIIQNILMVFSFLMIYKMLKIKSPIIILLFCCCFSAILYSMIIEQYVISVFFLVLFIYNHLYMEDNSMVSMGYMMSTSSLITNGALICWPSGKTIKENIKNIGKNLLKGICSIMFFMLAFGRGNVISSAVVDFKKLLRFSTIGGNEVTIGIIEKLQQYSVFIKNCFIMPDFVIKEVPKENVFLGGEVSIPVFWLKDCNSFDIIGIGILLLFLIQTIYGIFNKETEKISKITFVWFCMSIFCMIFVGWGAIENGFTIYILYFGWVFIVALCLLINNLKSIKLKHIIYTFLTIGLMGLNISPVVKMIEFATMYYAI